MIYEALIWTAPSKGPGHVQEGDVVDLRPMGEAAGLGLAEVGLVVSVRLAGLEPRDVPGFKAPLPGHKKRLNVPLARLQQRRPDFDLARARNPRDAYQPFQPVDSNGLFVEAKAHPALPAAGLVRDKKTGKDL